MGPEFKLFDVEEELTEGELKLIRCAVQKRLCGVIAYAHFQARQLLREGIHGNVHSSVDVLPDGVRVVIEYRIVTVDKVVFDKFRRSMYKSAYDYAHDRYLRKAQRLIEEGKLEEAQEEEGVVAGGSGAEASAPPEGG